MQYYAFNLAILVVIGLGGGGCKSDTGFGISLKVPLFGELEVKSDPIGCVKDEAKGVGTALGLAAATSK